MSVKAVNVQMSAFKETQTVIPAQFRHRSRNLKIWVVGLLCALFFYSTIYKDYPNESRWFGAPVLGGSARDVSHPDHKYHLDEHDISEYNDPYLDITHYRRSRKSDLDTVTPPVLLLLAMNGTESHIPQASGKYTLSLLLRMLQYSQLDLRSVSLGLLTTSRSEYESYKNLTTTEDFKSVSIVLHPGYLDTSFDPRIKDGHHLSADISTSHTALSTLRNYLMFTTLQSEPHLIWLHAVTPEICNGLLPRILRRATAPDVGLITYMNHKVGVDDSSSTEHLIAQRQTDQAIDDLAGGVIKDLDEVNNSEQMLGSEVLYMRSNLVRLGLTFATDNETKDPVIGRGRSAGIETRRLCETARFLRYKSYRMSRLEPT